MSTHKIHTDALGTLGTIIGADQQRDAIHIAVEPVVAGMTLTPGEHIHIIDGKAFLTTQEKSVGIVDPFLPCYVNEGTHFWLLLKPRTIKSLRHVWSHPAFPEK